MDTERSDGAQMPQSGTDHSRQAGSGQPAARQVLAPGPAATEARTSEAPLTTTDGQLLEAGYGHGV